MTIKRKKKHPHVPNWYTICYHSDICNFLVIIQSKEIGRQASREVSEDWSKSVSPDHRNLLSASFCFEHRNGHFWILHVCHLHQQFCKLLHLLLDRCKISEGCSKILSLLKPSPVIKFGVLPLNRALALGGTVRCKTSWRLFNLLMYSECWLEFLHSVRQRLN